MPVVDLEYLEGCDRAHTIKGREGYSSKFSISLGNGILTIKDMGNQVYRLPFPIPITLSIQNLPGTLTVGNSQSPNGSVKASYVALAGEGSQNNQKFSVFFSSSSSVLSI